MNSLDLTAHRWEDYELLDSGDNRKLERWGKFVTIRPETQAIWRPARREIWKDSQAEFRFAAGGKGAWHGKQAPEPWTIARNGARCSLRLTAFKHTGLFPEQEPNWEWVRERANSLARAAQTKDGAEPPRVLNLFGYTGMASIVAAQAGAQVTHCDASKQSNAWAHDNARLSGVGDTIRYITDDALKFVQREVRRGVHYDGIILDPPAFGRGTDGEVWRIEEHLVPMLDAVREIFAEKPGAFFLLNGYAAGYAPRSFLQAVESAFPKQNMADGGFGELRIGERSGERVIPSGIYVRFVR